MGRHDSRFRFEKIAQRILEHLAPDVGVEGGERVVEEVNIRLAVKRAGNRKALPLPAGERRAAAADHRRVPIPKVFEIRGEGRGPQHLAVPRLVEGCVEDDVVPHRSRDDPRLLRGNGDGAAKGELCGGDGAAADALNEGRFAAADFANEEDKIAELCAESRDAQRKTAARC